MQSKTLGARIASILREREADDAAAADTTGPDREIKKKKKRRYKVVIHSSPYLRCIQTSIAISAGLASNPSSLGPALETLPTQPLRVNQTSSFSNPTPTRVRPTISTNMDSMEASSDRENIEKVVLRLDPFLGEWQSPDYFEHITPPPRSSLMLMTAKAELLRKENYSAYPHLTAPNVPTTPSQLWNSSRVGSSPLASFVETPETIAPALENLPSLGDALPDSNLNLNGTLDRKGHMVSFSESTVGLGYKAPVPPYAISSAEPIPQGYVAHARDACNDVDYQWDSTQTDLGWGDAGVLPEEWAAMHKRFRKGLRRLVEWYSTTDHPGEMVTETPNSPILVKSHPSGQADASAVEDDDATEIDNVVILVSHGAGCNALVGGITNQPVLADVPMSSLSIARRRPEFDTSTDAVDNTAMTSLDDALAKRRLSVADLYDLKLFANTDHLHSAVSPPTVSRSSSIAGTNGRARFATPATSALKEINLGAQYGQSPLVHRSNSANASLGSMRRGSHGPSLTMRSPSMRPHDKGGITVGSGVRSFSSANRSIRSGSIGLWQPKPALEEEQEEEDMPLTLNFSHEKDVKKPTKEAPEEQNSHLPVLSPDISIQNPVDDIASSQVSEENGQFDEEKIPGLWAKTGNGGIWGAPRPPGEAERERDFTSQKRRWTVNEQGCS